MTVYGIETGVRYIDKAIFSELQQYLPLAVLKLVINPLDIP